MRGGGRAIRGEGGEGWGWGNNIRTIQHVPSENIFICHIMCIIDLRVRICKCTCLCE